jgi:ABC-type enterochelin transport system substrate-binding protein
MKKYTILFVVFAVFALTACGSGSTSTETKDSTVAPVADTTAVADSTVVPVEAGATHVGAETPVSNEHVK